MKCQRLFNRARRRALKMSQGALGAAVGTNATTICWYEHGKSDELEARLGHDITNELISAAMKQYGVKRNAEQDLFMTQVWLYYREELKRENNLTKADEAEIRESIRRYMR